MCTSADLSVRTSARTGVSPYVRTPVRTAARTSDLIDTAALALVLLAVPRLTESRSSPPPQCPSYSVPFSPWLSSNCSVSRSPSLLSVVHFLPLVDSFLVSRARAPDPARPEPRLLRNPFIVVCSSAPDPNHSLPCKTDWWERVVGIRSGGTLALQSQIWPRNGFAWRTKRGTDRARPGARARLDLLRRLAVCAALGEC